MDTCINCEIYGMQSYFTKKKKKDNIVHTTLCIAFTIKLVLS